jgi:hypothetical protein
VVFYNSTDLNKVGEVEAGALPDMLTFTRDGHKLLVANEGEPSDDYSVDPEGSVSTVDLSNGVAAATVTTAGFASFNGQLAELMEQGLRVFGPGATLAQDLEPEYIAISIDGEKAWVAMQEANAVAELDIATGEITAIIPLGFKDHSIIGNELDASNDDSGINIRNWPVKGIYHPDAMTSYGFNGKTYYITANEGDSRDYNGFSEEFRVADLTLDAMAFPNAAELQEDANLGRLNVTSTLGFGNSCAPSDPANVILVGGEYDRSYVENNCVYSELYAYGARSFSIWSETGERVFDVLPPESEHGARHRRIDDLAERRADGHSFTVKVFPVGIQGGTHGIFRGTVTVPEGSVRRPFFRRFRRTGFPGGNKRTQTRKIGFVHNSEQGRGQGGQIDLLLF